MHQLDKEEFRRAYKAERDPNMCRRLAAVWHFVYLCKDIEDAAEDSMCSRNTVYDCRWKYLSGGIDALRDSPRSGRPPKAGKNTMMRIRRIVESMDGIMPKDVRDLIHEKSGAWLHTNTVRRHMHKWDMSPKTTTNIHVRAASPGEVRRWQRDIGKKIARMRRAEYEAAVGDVAYFVDDPKPGRKLWTKVGRRVYAEYNGRHGMVAVHGAITEDNRHCFRFYDGATRHTFLDFLKEPRRGFGKVFLIVDRGSPHTSRLVTEYLEDRPEIVVEYFPTGSPYLNAIEEVWHQAKRILQVSEYYEDFQEFLHVVSEYFRTVRIRLDIKKFMQRAPLTAIRNL